MLLLSNCPAWFPFPKEMWIFQIIDANWDKKKSLQSKQGCIFNKLGNILITQCFPVKAHSVLIPYTHGFTYPYEEEKKCLMPSTPKHFLKLIHQRAAFLLLVNIWWNNFIQFLESRCWLKPFRECVTVRKQRAFGGAGTVHLLDDFTELYPTPFGSRFVSRKRHHKGHKAISTCARNGSVLNEWFTESLGLSNISLKVSRKEKVKRHVGISSVVCNQPFGW